VADAPRYRIWPPLALGGPLLLGWCLTGAFGDPIHLPTALRVVGWALVIAFALWNGWCLLLMARHRTALLPGGSTTRLIEQGPYRLSRNPLYLGLIALDAGLALLWPSFWALILLPAGTALLHWGAILPAERYLRETRPQEYATYAARVRRWL
jgi:protein-S-isoprenylcysteine O-methyltransferase Ste14